MSALAVAGIDLYRRYLSPLKGFRCAHHAVHGRGSCSTFGRNVYGRFRFLEATRLLRQRFVECKEAARRVKRTQIPLASQPQTGGQSNDTGQAKGTDQVRREQMKKKQQQRSEMADCPSWSQWPGNCSTPGSCPLDLLSGLDACSCAL
jgi:putative component of membrane protein insertase Oxa1/YidC/SpoIIIJ protein YidD